MNKSIIFILIILTFGCGTKNINQNRIYIQDDKRYGELENGTPENDTLIELKNKKGTIIGIGKMAVSENNVSDLKFNLWKEYDSNGILTAEGNYKISSFIDCGMGGGFRAFYYYRIGKWKYFKKNGELDFVLDFVPKEHFVDTRCEGGDKMIFGIVDTIPLEYWDIVTANKIYELQKISFSNSYAITTMIPLNGKIYFETENDF
ncbi:hypothetical protein LB452_13300 [Psychroflexus sp. CAK8W]|uniref:Lipoprotein n=1 Tax=Psychroflexus longus TaxID=2873596 RepID=A0ABS7XNF2_9FLAO|nr:hypothetical protein [Psychroflexus longus]MBZ9779899.1 hypothetical protein [Psychroflexus longus]